MLVVTKHGPFLVRDHLGLLVSSSPASVSSSFLRSFRQLNESSKEAQINPSIVVIVVILTIIFFLSGCLHLLIRCIVRNPRRDPNSIVTLTALQGQLQQLFHLHDSGVEQAFIDTLPVFFYKSVKGLKEGADCAVCLCEFQGEDRLRLLPKCSHAFHMDCIDTWLLSHSTCPLCRRSLLPDGLNLPSFAQGPLLDSSRSSVDDAGNGQGIVRPSRGVAAAELEADNSHPGVGQGTEGAVAGRLSDAQRDQELALKQDEGVEGDGATVLIEEHNRSTGRVVTVKLGRFRIVEGSNAAASTSNNGSRRSYSVGSYEYVLDPSNLEVIIAPTPYRRRSSTPRRVVPGHRTTLSECRPEDVLPDPIVTPFDEGFFRGGSSPFVLRGPVHVGGSPVSESGAGDKNWISIDLSSEIDGTAAGSSDGPIGGRKSELSYKAKQAMLYGPRPGAQEAASSSRRAFSFRQPTSDAIKLKVSASRRSLSETEVSGWEDEERYFSGSRLVNMSGQISNTLPDRGATSFAKRTINWLVGKQKRIVHSSGQDNSSAGQR